MNEALKVYFFLGVINEEANRKRAHANELIQNVEDLTVHKEVHTLHQHLDGVCIHQEKKCFGHARLSKSFSIRIKHCRGNSNSDKDDDNG